MAEYGSLVCQDCLERLSLGKVLWAADPGKTRATGFHSGLAGGRGHKHNWQDDDLNYSVYAMLAKHCGHRLAVLTVEDWTELYPGRVSEFPDVPDEKARRADLVERPTMAHILPPDKSSAFILGYPLLSQQSVVLFTGYYDQLANPDASPGIWRFLAHWLSQPLVVETELSLPPG